MYLSDGTVIQTLNLTQGTTRATILGSAGVGLTDLAFDIYGNLWGITSTDFYSINQYTGVATLRGALTGGTLSGGARGLSSSPSGILYAMGFNDTNLYSINPDTGAATSLFNTGFLCQGALRWYNGFLYVTPQIAGQQRVVQIDVTAMTGTLLAGVIPFGNGYGLAVSQGVLYGANDSSYFQLTIVPGVSVSNSVPITIVGIISLITGATFATE